MDIVNEAENVRGEAIRFAREVLPPRPAAAAALPVNWNAGNNDDYGQFLNDVRGFFSGRQDGAGAPSTRYRLTELVHSYRHRRISRSRLHAEVCILFIGHANLFTRFERLRFMNDGSQETHRRIREWREDVRLAVMPEISMALENCSSAIEILTIMPNSLDRRDLAFIARTCFTRTSVSAYDRYDLLLSLATNPNSVRRRVLPMLEAASSGGSTPRHT